MYVWRSTCRAAWMCDTTHCLVAWRQGIADSASPARDKGRAVRPSPVLKRRDWAARSIGAEERAGPEHRAGHGEGAIGRAVERACMRTAAAFGRALLFRSR